MITTSSVAGNERRDLQPLPGLRVLVADDDPDAVLTLSALLQHEGHEVRGVKKAADVLRTVEEFHPDAVMLDIGMPDVSGYDVARQITERYKAGRPLLVAVTGWKRPSDRILAQLVGFDHHVAKPYDPLALLGLLEPLRRSVGQQRNASVFTRTSRRAIEIAGSAEALASFLGVPVEDLRSWTSGAAVPPSDVFRALVDIAAANALTPLALKSLRTSATK